MVLVWLRDFYRDFADRDLVHALESFLGVQVAHSLSHHPCFSDKCTECRGADRCGQGAKASVFSPQEQLGLQGADQDWSSLILVKDVSAIKPSGLVIRTASLAFGC
eukprot:65420-Rhodomonas_salina.4